MPGAPAVARPWGFAGAGGWYRPNVSYPERAVTPADPLRVVYVLGLYRSGTTVLSTLLGQREGYFCGGELRALWRELLDPESRCGCGQPLRECEVWRAILATAFGDDEERVRQVATEMLGWQTDLLGWTHTWTRMPRLLRQTKVPLEGDSPLARYGRRLDSLYQAIVAVTGAKVVVDSSKEPTDGAVLRALPGLRPVFVHIVRDPRGMVYSSLRIGAGGREVDESQWRNSAYAALSWSVGNLADSLLCRSQPRDSRVSVRYEDFVVQPRATLDRIAVLAGQPVGPPITDDQTFEVGTTHTVAGNDNRFRTGPVRIKQDTAWQAHLHPRDRAIVSAISAPLLAWYRYPIAAGHQTAARREANRAS